MEKENRKLNFKIVIPVIIGIVIILILVISNNMKSNIPIYNPVVEYSTIETNSANKVQELNNSDENTKAKDNIEFKSVNYGDTISNDFVSMTIEKSSISEELYPTNTSSVYSYIPNKDNEQYFYLTGNIKNISGDTYNVENIYATMTFDDKYNYKASLKADDGGNNFYGNNVKPLGNVKYYLYVSVPNELIESYSNCLIRFGFKENFERDYSNDFSLYNYRYEINVSR